METFTPSSSSAVTSRASTTTSVWTGTMQEEGTQTLLEWMTAHFQPLRVVDEPTFRAFCKVLRPEYQVPVRQTIRSRLINSWRAKKAEVAAIVTEELAGRRFGTTTDMWTSVAKRGCMVVTMHYITQAWRMRTVVVGFVRVLSPHSGVRLARHFLKCFKDFNIALLKALWSVTCDNASNNDTMAAEITDERPGFCDISLDDEDSENAPPLPAVVGFAAWPTFCSLP
jgi:hypothetical protein